MLMVLQRSLRRRHSRMSCHELGRIAKFNGDSRLVDVSVNSATVPLIRLM